MHTFYFNCQADFRCEWLSLYNTWLSVVHQAFPRQKRQKKDAEIPIPNSNRYGAIQSGSLVTEVTHGESETWNIFDVARYATTYRVESMLWSKLFKSIPGNREL